jgi:hypothetical protein
MAMPPQFRNPKNAVKKVTKFGKPSKPGKAKLKSPIGPSNNAVLQAIGQVGGASKKVPPFMG